MTTTTRTLTTAIWENPYCDPLRNGEVKIPGIELKPVSVTPHIQAFRRMTRNLEFDICEMVVVSYYMAIQYGVPITGIPVFPLARFVHDGITLNTHVAKTPKDLEGKSVGMRAYTSTPDVWARGMLQQEHGVDLDAIHYIMSDDEHVIQYNQDPDIPKNLEYRVGANLQKMLAEGEIACGLRVPPSDHPHLKSLYPDGRAAGIAAYERMGGVYPLMHIICIRNDILEEMPWLAGALVEVFKESKETHRKRTGAPIPAQPYDDPMPIGLDNTRKGLEVLMRLAVDQHIIKTPLKIDKIFPGNLN